MLKAAAALAALKAERDEWQRVADNALAAAKIAESNAQQIAALKADAERKDAALESAETFIKRLRVPQNVAQAGWQVTQGAAVLNAIHAARAEKL